MFSLPPIDRRTALQQLALALAAGGLADGGLAEAAPRVVPEGQLPSDRRLGGLEDLDGYFPLVPSANPEEWEKRAEYVRRQILLACGLWPMPPRPEIKPTIHGLVDRPEYTVEKVYFESAPGLYVTGSLYRPKGGDARPRPVVLCPHGHWANGRFHDWGADKVKTELELGAEKFEAGGRHPLQARCVHLARMGCVVFHYDMIGYADSAPLSFDLAHRFGMQRPEMSSPDRWGLFSAQSELRLLNIMGLQTFNSIRALDLALGLPEIDPKRIGVTGASGGGTQTFILMAIDPRPAAAFPAVMVSTAMQGGCTCENASYLRVETGNIEFAALAAPRPVGMTGANDWTKEIESKGYPELKQHYAMMGVPDRVVAKYYNFEHNYNAVSRKMMYEFFNKYLDLGRSEPIEERDFTPLSISELSVWDDAHPKPKGGDDAELALLRAWDDASNKQLRGIFPSDDARRQEFQKVVGGALEVMIGRSLPKPGQVTVQRLAETDRGAYREVATLLRYHSRGEEVPAVQLVPRDWKHDVVIWIHERGKEGLFQQEGQPIPAVKKLLDAGKAVVGIDVLYTGEFLTGQKPLTELRRVGNNREFAGYTLGYNHPLFAQRVHDILTAIAAVRHFQAVPVQVHLAGFGQAGPWVAAAAALVGDDAVRKVAVGTGGFRFASLTNVRDLQLLPGAVKYGDLPAVLSLVAARHALWLSGEPEIPPVVAAISHSTKAFAGSPGDEIPAAADWLAGG